MKHNGLTERVTSARRGFILESTGLILSGEPFSFGTWLEIGREIQAADSGWLWALGDWLKVGVARDWTGPGFAAAIKATGYSRSHLSRALAQAEAWPRDARVLPWSHLNQIRRLPDHARDRAVALTANKQWPVEDVEAYVNQELSRFEKTTPVASPSWRPAGRRRGGRVGRPAAEITCPHCGKSFVTKSR
jgi:hypothetical protein